VMDQILVQAEEDAFLHRAYEGIAHTERRGDFRNALCGAACTAAKELQASAILALTRSGDTARALAKFRPEKPILAFTPEERSFHQLSMAWGIQPILTAYEEETEKRMEQALTKGREQGLIGAGDSLVIAAGTRGGTDLLKLLKL